MSRRYKPKNSKKRNIALSAIELVTTVITAACSILLSICGFIGSIVE